MPKKKKQKLIDEIPLVKVPADRWDEMLSRAGGDSKLAQWIWSCWVFNGMEKGE